MDQLHLTRRLVAGADYPTTYRDFVEMFPCEEACLRYVEALRWHDGFLCPACGSAGEPWRATRGRLVCRVCRHQASVTAGTVFDKTRTPLTTWFEAAWHVTTAKNGMSAQTLASTLGTSYRVAWALLQRYRVAMVRAERETLRGDVEVDETFVGGVDHGGKRGRGAGKCVVVIAVEVKQLNGFGRVRMRHVPDAAAASLEPFICAVVKPGSTVLTDGWSGYNGLPEQGYTHKAIPLSLAGPSTEASMPGVHRVAALLKRWILGTHQGSADPAHLQSYLEEFTFRFNRRSSSRRGLVFRRLIEQAVVTKPVTEADVTHGYEW